MYFFLSPFFLVMLLQLVNHSVNLHLTLCLESASENSLLVEVVEGEMTTSPPSGL